MKKTFTQDEVRELSKNPNVYSVSDVEIQYTNAFKEHFVKRYIAGDSPIQIFREAGFDSEMLGYKRIERATYRWKRAYEAGTLAAAEESAARAAPSRTVLLTLLRSKDLEIRRLERRVKQLSDSEPRR